jgi:hypothetical protein
MQSIWKYQGRAESQLFDQRFTSIWLLTKDHKRIAILYLITVSAFFAWAELTPL